MAFKDNIKEHPVISAIIGLAMLMSGANVTSVISFVRYVDNLPDKTYVTQQVDAKDKQWNDKFESIEKNVDRIRAFTEVVPELKNLITLECMGSDGLRPTINRLKNEYRALTGEAYVEPECDRLVAGR